MKICEWCEAYKKVLVARAAISFLDPFAVYLGRHAFYLCFPCRNRLNRGVTETVVEWGKRCSEGTPK